MRVGRGADGSDRIRRNSDFRHSFPENKRGGHPRSARLNGENAKRGARDAGAPFVWKVSPQAVAAVAISSSSFSSDGASVSMKLLTENTAFPGPGGP